MILPIPFQITDWNLVPTEMENGERGRAAMQTLQLPGLRIRVVEYSKNYLSDHWCAKGHLLFCLDGEFVTEFQDGSRHVLGKNMSFQVSNGMSSHRTHSATGAKLLIIDGEFLNGAKRHARGVIGFN